jgi:hypothetical protein
MTEGIELAKQEAKECGLTFVKFEIKDAQRIMNKKNTI